MADSNQPGTELECGRVQTHSVFRQRDFVASRQRISRAVLRADIPDVERFVDREIVPLLLRSARLVKKPLSDEAITFDQASIQDFTQRVLASDEASAADFLVTQQAKGVSIEALYLGLFQPTARLMGELWEADACSFTEVTLGVWRLHRFMREYSSAFQSGSVQPDGFGRVLLVPLPGEQHTFGLLMVAEFLRRSGWNVTSGPLESTGKLVKLVKAEKFAIVGFSVSAESQLGTVTECIRSVRTKSRDKALCIMVGGRVFSERPELVASVGADMTAADALDAADKAEEYAKSRNWNFA